DRDAGRNRKAVVRRIGERLPHEIGPDRKRRLGAGKTHARVVVEADPDRSFEHRREADEPRVLVIIRRAGLAAGRMLETLAARGGSGAALHDAFEDVRHQIGVGRGDDAPDLETAPFLYTAAGLDDARDRMRRDAHAAVGEHAEDLGHVEYLHRLAAEDDARIHAEVRRHAETHREIADRFYADVLGDARNCRVERMLDGFAHGDEAVELAFVVARRPYLALPLPLHALVHDGRRGAEVLCADPLAAESGKRNDRLERRSRLAAHVDRAVELPVLVAASDHRADL